MLGALKSAAQTVADGMQSLASAGLGKAKACVEEVAAIAPDLAEIGYHVTSIELGCALSPTVTLYLNRTAAPPDEAFDALLARRTSSSTLRTLVTLLRQTEKIIAKFDLRDRRCASLAVELGIPPRVRLIYTDHTAPTELDYVI